MINIQAKSEGRDPSKDCLKDLSPECRSRAISKVLLGKVTDVKGVVCFGPGFREPMSWSCYECSGGDVKCGIEPRRGWRWMDIRYLAAVVGIAGYFLFPLLLCLLPSWPDIQNGIELTAPQTPSPLSFTNVFVKCFSNKLEHCFRDALVACCCRVAVLLGLLPSIWYLYAIAIQTLRNKVVFFDITQDSMICLFHNDGGFEISYYAIDVLVLVVAVAPLVRHSLKHEPTDVSELSLANRRINSRCLKCFVMFSTHFFSHHNYVECTKRALKVASVHVNSCFWNFFPLCCQDNRTISKVWKIPTWVFCILSPCFLLFCVLYIFSSIVVCIPYFAIISYLMHSAIHISDNIAFIILFCLLSIFVSFIQIMIIVVSAVHLTAFVTYTLIGFVLNYKLYLPLVSAVILVISYIYHCYHTTNESYDELRKLVFEVCVEQQRQLDSSEENNVVANHQSQQEQQGERQPLLQGCGTRQRGRLATGDETTQKLVYIDENTGSLLISKKLFENICWKLKPVGPTFCVMVAKMVALTMFVMMIFVVVLTLTPPTEFGVLTQSTVTLFVGSLPRVVLGSSNNTAKKELQILGTKKCIKHCVMYYLENGELSGEQFLRREKQAIYLI